MKNLFTLFLISMLAIIGANAQKINDKVLIEYSGEWYNGKILKVNANDELYFVTYEDWGNNWDEWVGTDRIKFGEPAVPKSEPPAAPAAKKFKVGDKVEVEYGMIPEPATIIEVGENKYHIKFDKSLLGDTWVIEKKIKKL